MIYFFVPRRSVADPQTLVRPLFPPLSPPLAHHPPLGKGLRVPTALSREGHLAPLPSWPLLPTKLVPVGGGAPATRAVLPRLRDVRNSHSTLTANSSRVLPILWALVHVRSREPPTHAHGPEKVESR